MASAPGALSITDAGRGLVLLAGELDAWTGAQLRRRLLTPPLVRVIDLADVTFIDASGLRVLIDAREQRHTGSRLRLRNPSLRVVQLCDITGLTGALLETTDSDWMTSGHRGPSVVATVAEPPNRGRPRAPRAVGASERQIAACVFSVLAGFVPPVRIERETVMAEIDPNEPPLFDVDEIAEGDVEGDESKGGLTLEGVEIPFDILEHGNGRLPDSALERIGIGGHRLHRDAAAAFARFREAARGAGIDLTLTDSYRSFDEQVDLKRRKPGLSATPGKSVHGWGFAVDVSIGMPPKGFGESVYSWLKANGPGIGWHLGRPKDEPWHWVYRGPTGTTPATDSGTQDLVVGSSGDRVRQLQQCLQITADGKFGPQTEAAVKAFQQQHGLTVDGCVGPKTWAVVLAVLAAATPAAAAEAAPAAAPVARPELVRGSSGDHVVALQQRLGITADGKFGPQTEAAVKAFQQQHGLTVDGRVGPKTWAALGG